MRSLKITNAVSIAIGAAISCVCAKLLVMYTGMDDVFVIGAMATTVGLAATSYLIDRMIDRQNRENEKRPAPRSVDQIIADRARNSPF